MLYEIKFPEPTTLKEISQIATEIQMQVDALVLVYEWLIERSNGNDRELDGAARVLDTTREMVDALAISIEIGARAMECEQNPPQSPIPAHLKKDRTPDGEMAAA